MHEVIVPGGYGRSLEVRVGQKLTVIDVEGKQVADFIAFNVHDFGEFLSPSHTRSKSFLLNLALGDFLWTNRRSKMFEVIVDDVGVHDLITAACDNHRYVQDYGVKGHRNCHDNFMEALARYNIDDWRIPDPVNLFQNAPIRDDKTFGNKEPLSKPGDKIVFRVLMDAVVAISACPQDLNPCNGWKITDIKVLLE